jgi:hypothetical protein
MTQPDMQITYDREIELTAPPGGVTKAIIVRVSVTPKDGAFLIYGHTSQDTLTPIRVQGNHDRFELPFTEPKVYIKYLTGLTSLQIETIGYRDSARS